jgi:predicted NAD/FAD-binding protein
MSAPLLTRRDVVRGAVAAASLGVGIGGPSSARDRVAIIGAGAGGIAAAYFLGGPFDVEVFEARSKIGGHCDSHLIDYRGRRLTVDLGAQFFHPATHPVYVTLLEELGLYDPAHPAGDETIEAPGSLCIFRTSGGAPIFSSASPLSTLQLSIQFASFAEEARNAVLAGMPWETTIDGWIRSLPVSQQFKDEIAYPWLTALIGSPRADALRASARSILQTFALSFPADVAQGATTYNSRLGLQGNLERMRQRSAKVRVHVGVPTTALVRGRSGWFIQTRAGRRGPYRFVVLNAPPHAGRHLLPRSRAFAEAISVLDAYEYFDSRLLIHTDPAYVDGDRRDWSSYNAELRGSECEGSVWYGALRGKLPSGATIDVFKSWATRRRIEPRKIVLQRRFKHPIISAPAVRAARALEPLQGRLGLYFSGQYTTGFDSQESAVYSAMKVAEALAPGSRRLRSLKARLAANGLADVSYEL